MAPHTVRNQSSAPAWMVQRRPARSCAHNAHAPLAISPPQKNTHSWLSGRGKRCDIPAASMRKRFTQPQVGAVSLSACWLFAPLSIPGLFQRGCACGVPSAAARGLCSGLVTPTSSPVRTLLTIRALAGAVTLAWAYALEPALHTSHGLGLRPVASSMWTAGACRPCCWHDPYAESTSSLSLAPLVHLCRALACRPVSLRKRHRLFLSLGRYSRGTNPPRRTTVFDSDYIKSQQICALASFAGQQCDLWRRGRRQHEQHLAEPGR